MRRRSLLSSRLLTAVAAIELAFGIGLYQFLGDFSRPVYDPLRPYFPQLSAAFLTSGVILIILLRYALKPGLVRWLIVAPAVPLVVLCWNLGWIGKVTYGGLSLGLLLGAWLPPDRADAFRMTTGAIQAVLGSMMLFAPALLLTPQVQPIYSLFPYAGAAGLAGAFSVWFLRPRHRAGWWLRPLHVVSGILPATLAYSFIASQAWTGMVTWVILTMGLLMPGGWLSHKAGAGAEPPDSGNEITAIEGMIEDWTWVVAIAVACLSAFPGPSLGQMRAGGALLVGGLAGYNLLAYWLRGLVGRPSWRIFAHLLFVSVCIAVFADDLGTSGQVLLVLLVVIPAVGTRALGKTPGLWLMAVGIGTVLLGRLLKAGVTGALTVGFMAESAVTVLTLLGAGLASIRTTHEQRQAARELNKARAVLERQVQELAMVNRLSADVRNSLDLDIVLQTAVDEVGEALAVSRCFIGLVDCDTCFDYAYQYIAPGGPGQAYTGSRPVVALAMNTRQVVASADLAADARLREPALGNVAELLAFGVKAAMVAPLIVGDTVLGVIGVNQHGAPRPWSTAEQEFLETMASQVGVAIAHARAHGELTMHHARLQTLYQDLQASNEELLAQQEELQAQQEELQTQQEELQAQHEELETQSEALRVSEERFRVAFHDAPIGMALVSGHLRFAEANQQLCDMLGYTLQEVLALSVPELLPLVDPADGSASADRFRCEIERGGNVTVRCRHKSGRQLWLQVNASTMRTVGHDSVRFILQIQDVTERKEFEGRLAHAALYDPVTQLLNRRGFRETLNRHLAEVEQTGKGGALLFLDLDQFKYVNDSLGHGAGDRLLHGLADVLRQQVRATDTLGRVGGDEFAILLPGALRREAEMVAGRIVDAVRQHAAFGKEQALLVSTSVGITLFPEHGSTEEELMAHADLAMYQVKENGRNGFAVYQPENDRRAQMGHKIAWERRIQDALEQNRLLLYCQPILKLGSNTISQYELLLRMVSDNGEIIPPGAFLDIAERFGLIREIDRWVVREAIRMLAQSPPDLVLEVNLSGRAFTDPELLPLIARELSQAQVNPANLILEITETAAVADTGQARRMVEALKELGCRVAIDDFGAGFSSFYYLKHLPADYLKIDGSFIQHIATDPADQHLVKAMVQMARGLGKETVAEFVEDAEALRVLREYGVDYAQGYYVGRPGPVSEVLGNTAR